jgi:hypothetical protein
MRIHAKIKCAFVFFVVLCFQQNSTQKIKEDLPVFVNVYGAQESIRAGPGRAGTTNRVAVPARQAGIDSWAP